MRSRTERLNLPHPYLTERAFLPALGGFVRGGAEPAKTPGVIFAHYRRPYFFDSF